MILTKKQELIKIIDKMDIEKKIALKEYGELLLDDEKFTDLKKEIQQRRLEVSKGEIISEDKFWQDV